MGRVGKSGRVITQDWLPAAVGRGGPAEREPRPDWSSRLCGRSARTRSCSPCFSPVAGSPGGTPALHTTTIEKQAVNDTNNHQRDRKSERQSERHS